MINILSKSYSGTISRPKVKTIQDDFKNTLHIFSQWGDPNNTEALLLESEKDEEVTRKDISNNFCEEKSHLIATLNSLNSKILEKHNKKSYTTGTEVLSINITDRKLTWVQAGQPSLYVIRNQSKLIPLAPAKDLSVEFSMLTPLPAELLGLNKSLNIQAHDFHLEPKDLIFMFYGAYLNPKIFDTALIGDSSRELILEKIAQSLIKQNPEQSFWIALATSS